MNVNIIQFPLGWPMSIAIRNNLLTFRTERTLLYETDTEVGSSGSPVFNDDWQLVALHHWGHPFLERRDDRGETLPDNVNEGVRISAITKFLMAQLPTLTPDQQALLRAAIDASDGDSDAQRPPTRRRGPCGSPGGAFQSCNRGSDNHERQRLRVTFSVPLSITRAARTACRRPAGPRCGRSARSGGRR
jgi:hypothetical protein